VLCTYLFLNFVIGSAESLGEEKMTSRLSSQSFFSASLLAVFMLSACATQQVRDPAGEDNEVREMIQQSKLDEQNAAHPKSDAAFFPQDLGAVSLKERSDSQELKNFEYEIAAKIVEVTPPEESKRQPAAQPAPGTTKLYKKSPFYNKKYEPANLSKEELTQQLFDADSVVVEKGDTFSTLAQKHFGNKEEWNKIWALNPNVHNPDSLEVGATVFIPRTLGANRAPASTPAVADKKETPPAEVKAAPVAEAKPVVKAKPVAAKAKVAAPKKAEAPKAPKAEVKAEAPKEVKAAEAKPAPAKEAKLKTIPQLKTTVKQDVAKAEKAPKKETTKAPPTNGKNFVIEPVPSAPKEDIEVTLPTKEEKNVLEGAFLPAGTWNSPGHSTAELQKEHVDTLRYQYHLEKPATETIGRKPASAEDTAAAEEPGKIATLPKGITNIISYVGAFLLIAVLGGFFFSKPTKNS
jgi:hypothetical protein